MLPDRAPHLDRGQYRRVGVRLAVQVDPVPGECPQFLGTRSGQQPQHEVTVELAGPGGVEEVRGLVQSERLRRPTLLALRNPTECDHVALDQVTGHRAVHGPVQAFPEAFQRAGCQDLGLGREPPVHLTGAEIA
jgi:hypothetical protein